MKINKGQIFNVGEEVKIKAVADIPLIVKKTQGISIIVNENIGLGIEYPPTTSKKEFDLILEKSIAFLWFDFKKEIKGRPTHWYLKAKKNMALSFKELKQAG